MNRKVSNVVGQPFQSGDKWCIVVESDFYGKRYSHVLPFDSKEVADRVCVGYEYSTKDILKEPRKDSFKALSVQQPFASLEVLGIKDIENRTWKTDYRGRIYIHASAYKKLNFTVLTKEQYNDACDKFEWNSTTVKPVDQWDRSAIIGHVDIVDCVVNHPSIWAEKTSGVIDTNTKEFIPHRDNKPIYNWVLANAVLFDRPIENVKGALSFWDCSEYLKSII